MKTFNERTVIGCPNEVTKNFLIDYAVSKGVPVYGPTAQKTDSEYYSNLVFCADEKEICGYCGDSEDSISLEQFIQYCDNWKAAQPIGVRLNDSYIAHIDKANEVVRVGCQTIPFAIIAEVYATCFK